MPIYFDWEWLSLGWPWARSGPARPLPWPSIVGPLGLVGIVKRSTRYAAATNLITCYGPGPLPSTLLTHSVAVTKAKSQK